MKKSVRSVVVTFGLLLSTGFVGLMPALSQNSASVIRSVYSGRIGFNPPADDPYPGPTRGGATRGQCQATSLMPRNGSGLTAQARTSIYVHMARHPEAKLKQAILMLKADGNEREQYETIIDLPEEALSRPGGVLEIEFPESMPDLEVDKQYSWSLIMICDDLPIRPDSPVVGGGLRRVSLPSAVALSAEVTSVDRAIAYGEAGLWYDLLTTLASVPSEDPEHAELNKAWRKTLTEAGLSEEISKSALIN